jgi:hypothetical protein
MGKLLGCGMRAGTTFAYSGLFFIVVITAAVAVLPRANAELIERPFNQLTSLVVSDNLRSVQLFGIYNPQGPSQAIPYDRLFADAFQLPDEGVIQGFSRQALLSISRRIFRRSGRSSKRDWRTRTRNSMRTSIAIAKPTTYM